MQKIMLRHNTIKGTATLSGYTLIAGGVTTYSHGTEYGVIVTLFFFNLLFTYLLLQR